MSGTLARFPGSDPAALSLDDRIVELVDVAVSAALTRIEAAVEERYRTRRTHLTADETAEAMGIGITHCRRMIQDGTIPSVRLGDRVVVPVCALERLGVR